jgi:hypothetical protein
LCVCVCVWVGGVRNIFWVGFVTRGSVKSTLIFFEGWAIRDLGELFSAKVEE